MKGRRRGGFTCRVKFLIWRFETGEGVKKKGNRKKEGQRVKLETIIGRDLVNWIG